MFLCLSYGIGDWKLDWIQKNFYTTKNPVDLVVLQVTDLAFTFTNITTYHNWQHSVTLKRI
jgi:hypothetical protein